MQYGQTKKAPKQVYLLDTFEGVDFAKAASNVDKIRSPEAVNMTRDEVGKVRKRMGYSLLFSGYEGKIYGIHKLNNNFIIHSGTKLYREYKNGNSYVRTQLYADMNEHISVSFQFNGKLYIFDGKTYLEVRTTGVCVPVSTVATVPLIKIAGTPSGGGTILQEVNLLSNSWREMFTGDGTSHRFQLSFDNLDNTPLIVKVKSGSSWTTYTEGTHYRVYRETGQVDFFNSYIPAASTTDNVDIQASKDRSAYANRINKCSIAIKYGLNGQDNQLFVSGNSELKNVDWWCQPNDPTFFGDLSYATLGQDDSAIVSYSKLNSDLVTHKDSKSGTIFIRHGNLDSSNSKIVYPVKDIINGSGCICPYGSQNFGEPIFITSLGVQTITVQDYTLNQYEQVRGTRINSKLLEEANVKNAISCIWKDLYIVCINSHCYILDRLQKAYEKNSPYSTYQYAGEYWDNIPATAFLVDGNDLYFGTTDGKIMKFYTDPQDPLSYSDNGVAIDAYWTLPEFSGDVFFRNKNVKFIAVKLKSAIRTGIEILAQIDGVWTTIFEDYLSFSFIDFDNIDFDNFTFSTDATPKKAQTKVTIRKKDKTAFRLRNNKLEQPFGIYAVAFIYTEKGINKD